jgi:LacI family transcriptional regulator
MRREVLEMRVTMKDIARETGTSVPTVSLILSGKPFRVSEETRQKVLKAAEDMHYVRNRAASDLRMGVNNTIGLIVPDISNDFYSTFAKGVERECREQGWGVMLNNSDNQPTREREYIELMYGKNVEGIILASAAGDEAQEIDNMNVLSERGIPHVMLDLSGEDGRSDVVTGDHHAGGRTATEYLIRLGHRNIACITGPQYLEGSRSRLEGYRQALESNGLAFDPDLIFEGDYTYDTAVEISRMMDWGKFTAVFAFNDLMALAVCNVASEMGYSVPEDYSVVGYDDVFFSGLMNPGLTTMSQPLQQMGREAAEMLIRRVRDPKSERMVKIHVPKLVVRSSTALYRVR